MLRKAAVLGIVLLGLGAVTVRAQEQVNGDVDGQVIYGDDDRLNLYQVKIPKLLEMADSTVGLFSEDSVTIDPATGKAALSTFDYGSRYNLCPEEPFRTEKSGAFCSGSLVGPDLLMTAGHCVTSEAACKGTKFVFGFGIKKEGAFPDSVPASEVYSCGQLVGRAQENSGADWALIKLDRKVKGHKALAIARSPIAKGAKIIVIGHPAGLPTKIAGGAAVRDNTPEGYFTANLDTYGGNSGSAVFNAKTGLVEGILVRGETDYIWRGSCRVSNVCTNEGCRGEDVTKVSALANLIPPPSRRRGRGGREPELAEMPIKAPARGDAFGDLQRWSGVSEQ